MIGALRAALARRAVRRAVAARAPRPLTPDVRARRVLLLLPADEAGQRVAWAFVGLLGVPPRNVIPVRIGPVGYVPDAFAGAVRAIGPDEHDWRGLPKKSALASVWTQRPDVALDLSAADDLPSALLVGASPAAVRVGRHHADREPFYDLMVQADGDPAAAVARVLRQLDPPVLPIR